jgi:hypothetical protein
MSVDQPWDAAQEFLAQGHGVSDGRIPGGLLSGSGSEPPHILSRACR